MPTYKYQCQHCGLRFEALGDPAKSEDSKKCVCGKKAERLVPENIAYHFDAKTKGLGPQNTGISDLDYVADRIIAKEAEENWSTVDARKAHKRELLRDNPNASLEDLSREPDGTYSVMAKSVKEGAERVRIINNVAMQRLKRKRRRSKPL